MTEWTLLGIARFRMALLILHKALLVLGLTVEELFEAELVRIRGSRAEK